MRKYKTIMPKPNNPPKDILSLEKQIDNSATTEYTVQTCPASNRKIIVVNLPQSNHQHVNNLPASLYYTSLRRLKKQHSNHTKEVRIPEVARRKRFEQFAQQVYKPYSIDVTARNALPSLQLSTSHNKGYRQHEILQENAAIEEFQKRHNRSLTLNQKRIPVADQDQNLFALQSLKERFFKTIIDPSKEKYKLGLLEKDQTNTLVFQEGPKGLPNKMSREQKVKLNAYKTVIHPIHRSTNSKSSLLAQQGQQNQFIRRKQLKSTLLYHASREKLNLFGQKQLNLRLYPQKSPILGERNDKLIDYTPWETDQLIFD